MKTSRIFQSTITARESENVRRYFADVRRHPMLNCKDEEILAYRAKSGDKMAREKLIQSNLRFVISFANLFSGRGVPQEDLIQAGNIGLIHAAEEFEPNRGFKFSTYAAWQIQAAIMDEINKNGKLIHIPSRKQQDLNKILRYSTQFEVEKGIAPTMDEIANALKMPAAKVQSLLSLVQNCVSLNSPMGDETTSILEDILSNSDYATDKEINKQESYAIFEKVLSILPEREKYILVMYYGIGGRDPHTLESIANELGLSIERVNQLRNKAIKTIRKASIREYLK